MLSSLNWKRKMDEIKLTLRVTFIHMNKYSTTEILAVYLKLLARLLPELGYIRKKSTPPPSPRWKARFFDPRFHLDFQNCLSPPPLRISKFKDPPTHLDFHKIVRHRNFNLHSM